MARTARVVVPSVPYHITQRGNNWQNVFFKDDDRRTYLSLLVEQAELHGVAVHGYCLMTNHVHIVATPSRKEGLAQAIGRTHFRYTQYINRRRRRVGHLWQNRFYSCPLDETCFWLALCHVERNPVRARVVRLPWNYRWSSAAAHTGEPDRTMLLDMDFWRTRWSPAKWRSELQHAQDNVQVMALRRATQTGRPMGSDAFVARLERLTGRALRARPVGRPPLRDGIGKGRVAKKRRLQKG